MERAIRPSFSVGQPLAKAAIDLACYDLWGKQVGRSRMSHFSESRPITEIQLSWTINATSLEKAHEQLEQGRAAGYTSYNVKIGAPQTPDYDRSLVRAVREFAPQGFHWADANTSYDLATAKRMAGVLADAGFKALESPLPPNRLRDYQALQAPGRAADPDGRGHRLASRGGGVRGARHARRHRDEGRALRRAVACRRRSSSC